MKKPKAKKREVLNYSECAKFVAKKLKIKDLRDVDGKFDPKNSKRMDEIEYKDFWHFLVDVTGLSNGQTISIYPEMADNAEDWQKQIINKFVEEFGPDAEYLVEW